MHFACASKRATLRRVRAIAQIDDPFSEGPAYNGSHHLVLFEHGRLVVIERLILGAFLVLPLLIVAFLFSDELWQEHRKQVRNGTVRRLDWRHPLRSWLHRN